MAVNRGCHIAVAVLVGVLVECIAAVSTQIIHVAIAVIVIGRATGFVDIGIDVVVGVVAVLAACARAIRIGIGVYTV